MHKPIDLPLGESGDNQKKRKKNLTQDYVWKLIIKECDDENESSW